MTQVGTRSHLLTSSTRCLCGFSFFMYFSMYLDRVPWGSRASSTCMQCIQCLILLKNNTAHTFFTNKWQVCYHIPSYVSLTPRLFPPPVFDRLRCADMEGEEIWSRAVMSDRQRVDIKGAVPDKESQIPFPGLEAKSVCKAVWLPSVIHDAWDESMWNRISPHVVTSSRRRVGDGAWP